MSAARPRVEIVVDELVLRGVAPERAHELADAIAARLATLAERDAGRLTGRDEAGRSLPPVTPAGAGTPALGAAVAGAVWSVLVAPPGPGEARG